MHFVKLFVLFLALELSHASGSQSTELEIQVTRLENLLTRMEGSCSGLTDQTINDTVAFTAYRPDEKTLSPNEIIKFHTVAANSGNGYNAISGVFTAPKSGYYFLSSTLLTPDGELHCHIWVNNEMVAGVFTGAGWSTGTGSAVVMMEKGEMAFVKHGANHGYQKIHANQFKWNIFSGFLIH